MIHSLLSNRKPYFWMLFHLVLGLTSISSRWLFIIWFYIVFFSTIFRLFKHQSRANIHGYIGLVSYLVSFELLARMANTSPLVPYEVSKYLFLILFSAGLLISSIKVYKPGILMSFLMLPAFLYDLSGQVKFSDIVFNGLAPLGLGIGIAFMGKIQMELKSLHTVLRLIWYATLSVLIFVFIKTPDFETIDFNISANFETTGGESSNQVASVLGLGMVISFYAWLARLKFSGQRFLDLLIMVTFAFQGLLTFSRGGMIVGGMAMLILYFTFPKAPEKEKSRNQNRKSVFYLIVVAVIGFFTFQMVDKISGGKLKLRYQGETEGTVLGSREKTLNVITSNRLAILLGDIALWQKYFISGAGIGASKYLREGTSMNPHVELSRLLAEQGIPGLIYFGIFIYIGIRILRNRIILHHRSIMLAIYFIGFATCFHSATRTFITPLLVSLSSMLPLRIGDSK